VDGGHGLVDHVQDFLVVCRPTDKIVVENKHY
jgi:hypothetical protein